LYVKMQNFINDHDDDDDVNKKKVMFPPFSYLSTEFTYCYNHILALARWQLGVSTEGSKQGSGVELWSGAVLGWGWGSCTPPGFLPPPSFATNIGNHIAAF